jgi:SAM-dependent methyltransferase
MSHHEHGTHDPTDHLPDAELYSQETWDTRYAGSDRVWSGNPNQRLVEQVAGLPAGDALDVGAGEGADAVWLATQGWQVAALDVSTVALGRTEAHAAEAGVSDRVRTVHHDLFTDPAVPGTYDLVSAQFWHPPAERLAETVRSFCDAVRPGGHLLVVGHHPVDLSTGLRTAHGQPERLFTPDQVVAALPQQGWEVVVAQAQERPATGPEGRPTTLTDTVVHAVRR